MYGRYKLEERWQEYCRLPHFGADPAPAQRLHP